MCKWTQKRTRLKRIDNINLWIRQKTCFCIKLQSFASFSIKNTLKNRIFELQFAYYVLRADDEKWDLPVQHVVYIFLVCLLFGWNVLFRLHVFMRTSRKKSISMYGEEFNNAESLFSLSNISFERRLNIHMEPFGLYESQTLFAVVQSESVITHKITKECNHPSSNSHCSDMPHLHTQTHNRHTSNSSHTNKCVEHARTQIYTSFRIDCRPLDHLDGCAHRTHNTHAHNDFRFTLYLCLRHGFPDNSLSKTRAYTHKRNKHTRTTQLQPLTRLRLAKVQPTEK